MVRRVLQAMSEDDHARAKVGVVSRHEAASIRKTQDALASARCPLCHAVLVARQGRAGPYFHCRCVRRGRNRAA